MDAEYSSGVLQFVEHRNGEVVLSNGLKELRLKLSSPPQDVAYGDFVAVSYKDGNVVDISRYEITANQLQDAVLVED